MRGGHANVDIVLHRNGEEDTRQEGHQGKDTDHPIIVKGPGQDAQHWMEVVSPHPCRCAPYLTTSTRVRQSP
jgi:hypothetical protein